MDNSHQQEGLRVLSEVFSRIQDADICTSFLEDLCTPAELQAMVGRWQVAMMLRKKVPYRKINELTGVSTATITRVARFMEKGHGGYREAISLVESSDKS